MCTCWKRVPLEKANLASICPGVIAWPKKLRRIPLGKFVEVREPRARSPFLSIWNGYTKDMYVQEPDPVLRGCPMNCVLANAIALNLILSEIGSSSPGLRALLCVVTERAFLIYRP